MSLVRRSPVVRKRGFGINTTGGGGFTPLTYDTAGVAGTTLSGTSGTVSVPSGATQLVVEIWGGGGGGAGGYFDTSDYGGGGGGSGGYTKVTRALSSDTGKSISWARGSNGIAGTNEIAPASSVVCAGTNATGSSANCATLTNSFSIVAGGGGGGQIDTTVPLTSGGGGAGGTTGGDSGSTAGAAGTSGGVDTGGVGGAARVGIASRSAGAGGDGGLYFGAVTPTDGSIGRVIIYFT